MTDYYYNNPDHPLNGKFTIQDEWVTKIAQIKFRPPEDLRLGLIEYISKRAYSYIWPVNRNVQPKTQPDGADSEYVSKHHYNLLTDYQNNKFIGQYKELIGELIRYYIANCWYVKGVDKMKIEAKTFGNVQSWGRRTYPHYHHGFDGVIITYLTVGDEFVVDVTTDNLVVPITEPLPDVEIPESRKMPSTPRTHPEDFEEQGNMLICDPRPAISYPYNKKAISIKPEVGLNVLHPGYLWHESNSFTGKGIRVAIITNFNCGVGRSSDPLVEL